MADSSDIVYFHPDYSDLDASVQTMIFNPDQLKQAGWVTRELEGRGTTYFFRLKDRPVVLRHYWRGGAMKNLSKDAYLWLGLARTRSFKEWKLLQEMESLGLPTPRPVALRIRRSGLFYRSDIVTEELEGVESLARILQQRPATAEEWQLVGKTIGQFHEQQVHHADLNANNILLKEGACYWIDFDRGCIRGGDGWKESVIARLRRSLEKLRGKHDPFYFSDEGWKQMLERYSDHLSASMR